MADYVNVYPQPDPKPAAPNWHNALVGALLEDVAAGAEAVILVRHAPIDNDTMGGWSLTVRLRDGKTAHGEGHDVTRCLSDALREDADTGRKRCAACGRRLPLAEFSGDGVDRFCRPCRMLRARSRRARIKAQLADDRQERMDKVVEAAATVARKAVAARPLPGDAGY